MAEEFLLGLNYWPARKFVRMWSQFDVQEIDRDFAAIEAIGLRLVRLFLFWPDFQPSPAIIDATQLDNLATVFGIAADHNLLLMPALFVGHMSGPNWMPAWTMSDVANNRPRPYVVDGAFSPHKPRDIYGSDAAVLEAERLLVRTVVERFARHRGLWGWDLCNEIDLVQVPSTIEAAEGWLRTLVADVRAADREHPVTAGFLPWPDESPRGFKRASHRLVDVASVHAYPIYDPSSGGPGDVSYVGRTIEATRAAAGVPIMLTEFGMPVNPEPGTREITVTSYGYGGARTLSLIDEGEAAQFVRDVLPAARDAGATGALIWCFSDYDPSLHGAVPFDALAHERYFGIFDASGRLKATGEAMRDVARTLRR